MRSHLNATRDLSKLHTLKMYAQFAFWFDLTEKYTHGLTFKCFTFLTNERLAFAKLTDNSMKQILSANN